MANPNNESRDLQRPAPNRQPPLVHESGAERALRYARSEGLPEEKIQEVLRNPHSTPSDLTLAADNYNDDD